jgi:hypothetical protein
MYECRDWETEHYNSVSEITVSFLGIHKWETYIYIGFSPALHLQCTHILCKDWVVSSDKCHYVTPFSHKGCKKCLEFYKNYITLFCLIKNKLFDCIILTQNHAWRIT